MTTAHQLARKLLAGADYEIVLMVGDGRAGRVKTVSSMSGVMDERGGYGGITEPVIVIEPEPNSYDVKPYG